MSKYQNIETVNSIDFSNSVKLITGTNNPEGVVSAVIGSKYFDATNGVEYLKTSGTGNTGWEENVTISDISNKQDKVRTDKTIVNQVGNYTIPTIDIDSFQSFFINQTTTGILFQLGVPTGNAKKDIVIANIGSVSLQLFATQRVIVQPNTMAFAIFNGTNWSIEVVSPWLAEATGITFPAIANEINNIWLVRSSLAIGSGSVLPNLGAGVRGFWYPRKGAVRFGEVSGTEWNDSNIGTHSVAFGYNCRASGNYSFAHGFNAISTGVESLAFGENCTASQQHSYAFQSNTSATGTGAIAMGLFTTAQSFYSFVNGRYNVIEAGTGNSWVNTDLAYIFGNGTGAGTRNNAIAIQKNGSVLLNGTTGNLQNKPNASAILDLFSTDKGFLAPRLTTTQRNAITSPAQGLAIYNTDATEQCINTYDGTNWVSPKPYKQSFVVADWVTDGADYKITILATTHKKGAQPSTVNVFAVNGADYENYSIKVLINQTTGDVVIKVNSAGRVDGYISINW